MLQIRLLGQFDIRLDGKRVTIPSRAGQSLFAYLTLTAGTAHRREKLAGILWPDTTDENARKNLRQELWRIRKAISTQQPTESDYLIADEITLKFNRESEYWLDVSQMERPDLDLQSLISNLSLYQGELLPGFYDEWITLERERVQAVFEARMEQLLEQLITAERWIAVQEWGERWLTLSGAREPAYRALMLASGMRGDFGKVTSLYQRCTDELREYLGVEPSPETRKLYEGLLKSAKTPPRTAAQPSGTITFLFTDIEGSTRLLEKMGAQYADVLSEHHEILRAAVQKWNGREVDTQGDAFFITFTRAIDAVQCAGEAQRALVAHTWQGGEHLHVRMGLHTGEPLIASTGYVGMDVHRAARIGDAGHGGQILLSQTTRELVVHDLPEGMTIRDLGEHRLKDMKYPSTIYQLVVDGLPAEFAPIRTKFTGTEMPTPGEAPFKGLQFYDEGDSSLFFGRETLTAKLMNRLQALPSPSKGEGPGVRFLSVIIGASGSGKSSLVRAGLVPALKKKGSAWQVHVITPTAHPLEALAIGLTQESESVTAAATLVDDLSKDPRSLHFFLSRRIQTRQDQTRDSAAPSHTLLVIDQFEELFTLCRDEFEREAFIDNLLAALTPAPLPLGEERKGEGNITLVITLRADFYAHLAQYPELRDAVAQQQEYIGPMTTEELRSAIEEPARRGHWEFEPGLVDLILRDVGVEPGALPLLSHALLETWKRRAGHTLTLKGYADAGGVHGAIAYTAENVYQDFSLSEQAIVRNILLRLTEFGEGTEDTRRRASFDELMSDVEDADQVRAVLNTLAEARLVTLSENTAEVAHEALIREWPKLREWLSQDREGIILHRHLTEAAHEWELLERDAGSVYRGARLAQANEWSSLNPKALNVQERLFLDASNLQAKREEQERENQLQRELDAAKELAETQSQSASRLRARNRVITTVGSIAVILAILAGLFGAQSNQNAKDAQEQQQIAFIRELSAAAINNLSVDPELSILLSLEAANISMQAGSPVLVETQDALHRSIQTSRVLATLRGHDGGVWSLAVSRDGTQLATVSQDGTAKVWDVSTSLNTSDATNQELLTLPTQITENLIGMGAVFTPDGTQLLTLSGGNSATLWDISTGQALFTLKGHSDLVISLAVSPDGKLFATGSWDGTAKLWDAATGKELFTLKDEQILASFIAFSPDGSRLYTGAEEYTVAAWDVSTGEELFIFSEPGGGTDVTSIAASPDGTRVATGDFDTSVKIWDAATGTLLLKLFGHSSQAVGMAFSADSKILASANEDGTIKLWDAETGRALLTLSGHTSGVLSVTFSPDGNRLYTASRDGTVKVWDISPTAGSDWMNLVGHASRIGSVTYSPDGTRLATFGFDGTTKVWDVINGKVLLTLEHTADTRCVGNVSYSPDGSRLVVAGGIDPKIFNAVSGAVVLSLAPFNDNVCSIVFSPDGARLAAGDDLGFVRIYDSANGKVLFEFTASSAGIEQIAFSPDSKRLATANDDGATVWDAATGKKLLTFNGHGEGVRLSGITFSPDGKLIATAGNDSVIRVWNSETGVEVYTLIGHTGSAFAVAFSPDGAHLASSSVDRTIKIWTLPSNGSKVETPLTLYGHTGAVYRVAFSPDGLHLATVGRNSIVRIYSLNIEDLIALAKSRLTRTLTTEECQKYLHVEVCPAVP